MGPFGSSANVQLDVTLAREEDEMSVDPAALVLYYLTSALRFAAFMVETLP